VLKVFVSGKIILLVLLVGVAVAEDSEVSRVPQADFGGPNAVPNQIQSDVIEAAPGVGTQFGENWDAWKASLQKDHGFGLGTDYTAYYLNASETVPGGRDSTGAGLFRVYGAWDLVGRKSGNTGSFIWKFEHRHGYANPAPSPLWAATELGYIGLLAPPFNDQDFRTQNFYWRQRLNQGKFSFVAGFLDATDFLDLYGMVSPWLHFTNFVFSTGSATLDVPNDAGLGAGFGAMLTDNVYLIGSFVDANGNPNKFWESIDTVFDENEFFKSIELGWTSGKNRIYVDNYHVTLWHKDARTAAGKPSGWGANFSFARFVDNVWNPFLRGGYSDDGDSLLSKSLTGGIGYRLRDDKDLLGFGLNWGEPNPNQGAGTKSQYAAELFYRLLVGKRLNLTADLQYIRDPAANPFESSIWVGGLRGRLAF
jgi:porin